MALIPVLAVTAGMALGSAVSYLLFGGNEETNDEIAKNTGLINNNFEIQDTKEDSNYLQIFIMIGIIIIITLLIMIFTIQLIPHCKMSKKKKNSNDIASEGPMTKTDMECECEI